MSDSPWSAPTPLAVEYEIADMLYGLVRALKPKVCFESGRGASTASIATAIEESDGGEFHSADPDEDTNIDESVFPTAKQHVCSGLYLAQQLALAGKLVDFAFLDSGTVEDRIAEFDVLRFSEHPTVVLHDALKDSQKALDHIISRGWKVILIRSPRGCAICQPS